LEAIGKSFGFYPKKLKMSHVSVVAAQDIICPWCYLGIVRMQRALDYLTKTNIIKSYDFSLMPHLIADPKRSSSKVESYAKKFRNDAPRMQAYFAQMIALGKSEPVPILFNFTENAKFGNSRLGHKLLMRTRKEFGSKAQIALSLEIYKRYHERGLDVSKEDVLLDCLEKVSGELVEMKALLLNLKENGFQTVVDEPTTFQQPDVEGVPVFKIHIDDGNVISIPGAQDEEYWVLVFTRLIGKASL
jgi:predicted DsbA family dithiol-disulfide isomerase